MTSRPRLRRAAWIFLPVVIGLVIAALEPVMAGEKTQPEGSRAPGGVSATAWNLKELEMVGGDEPGRKMSDWEEELDKGFEQYLVKPLQSVLFFDFGTAEWLNRRPLSKVQCLTCETKFENVKPWPSEDPPEATPCPKCVEQGKTDKDGEVPEIQIVQGTSVPLVVLWLLVGAVFFTFRMGFINIRGFWHGIQLTRGHYDNPDETGEVSHFQALASALSATIGLGNIAGMAIAVGVGGPGAIFWMIVAGVLGMTSKFAECSLSQMYRKVDRDGTVSGGPMHYLYAGLKEIRIAGVGLGPLGAVLAVAFAVVCMGGSFGGGCAFQVNQSLGAIREQIASVDGEMWILKHGRLDWIYGLAMAGLVGLVIIGGIRRIAATAERIVPLMCVVYVVTALCVLCLHYDRIGEAFGRILSEAFTWDSAYGGFLGVLVTGIRRAAFSNEAGIGSAAIAHAAAKTEEPIREGIVASLGPFIDTVVICTMTGLVIVVTGAFEDPQYAHLVAERDGAALTSNALGDTVSWFPWVLCVAVMLFAYSTMISWSYYGERCWSHLFGSRVALLYRLAFLGFVVLGAVVKAQNVLDFSDLMILSMAFPNILGVALLSGKIRRALNDYWRRYKAGEMEPKRAG
ncbi:MAG: alanine/glycine:cation symporter family protein [Planctomycetota bacterium]|jgi:AGCS family alanine or glycine:cation symporter